MHASGPAQDGEHWGKHYGLLASLKDSHGLGDNAALHVLLHGVADEETKVDAEELCGQVHGAEHGGGERRSESWVFGVLDEEHGADHCGETDVHGHQSQVADSRNDSLDGFILSLELHVSLDAAHLHLAVDEEWHDDDHQCLHHKRGSASIKAQLGPPLRVAVLWVHLQGTDASSNEEDGKHGCEVHSELGKDQQRAQLLQELGVSGKLHGGLDDGHQQVDAEEGCCQNDGAEEGWAHRWHLAIPDLLRSFHDKASIETCHDEVAQARDDGGHDASDLHL